jgi:hypothetical protein
LEELEDMPASAIIDLADATEKTGLSAGVHTGVGFATSSSAQDVRTRFKPSNRHSFHGTGFALTLTAKQTHGRASLSPVFGSAYLSRFRPYRTHKPKLKFR